MSRGHRVQPSPPQRRTPGSPSDKENLESSTRIKRRNQVHNMSSSRNNAKRQRLGDRTSNIQGSQSLPLRKASKDFYDPDQDEKERRRVRKGLRDLTRDLNDSRNEYMQAGNTGIHDTILRANEYFQDVKQTSDATIDSRLLVNAADLSYKKTAALVLGDSSAGIDVDEFVSKCISFMRAGPEDPNASISSTQRRRAPRRTHIDPDRSDEEDQGDGMNWDWLGRAACFRHSSRPAVSGFLLGPLSVQKRTRQIAQRRARERIDPSQAVRPQELREEDLDKQETSNLTAMCTSINKLLGKTRDHAEGVVTRLLEEMEEDPSEEQVQEIMAKHNIADDGGVPLFKFCINPQSFGQSVENLFYLSFLVRDGTVGISTDSRGLPTLHPSKPLAPSEAQRQGIQKRQSVFSLDFDTWQDLVEAYSIQGCIIPHLRMSSGSIAVFSPVNLTPAIRETLAGLGGRVKYIAALDLEHHLHLTAWKNTFPDAEIIAPEGLWEKRQSVQEFKDTPFKHIFRQANKDSPWTISEEFDHEFDIEYVYGHGSKEIVFLHKPSCTVIEGDLLFNLPAREQYSKTGECATSGIWTKIVKPLLSTAPPATWQKRFAWYILSRSDRKAFTESMRRIDKWEFNRLIPCHGDVIESGAKGVFRTVFEWFL
ncbi:Nse4 C-terminal-domain-containing protein [Aspergillus lucknowensis]|uniref:Non-structural maintenance of chromosomes element 4 n=1 Tax=Aspergillus lucknowensis TaxID=176173 RepID=A0ABR4LVF7_9EURO